MLQILYFSGVAKGSLTLPIPSSTPESFKLLMTMCWNQKPTCRPPFHIINKHLSIDEEKIQLFEEEQTYNELARAWSTEINEQLANLPTIDMSVISRMTNEELVKKRKEEIQHLKDIRTHYQKKVEKINELYVEMKSMMMQLQKREQQIKKKERELKLPVGKRPIAVPGKPRPVKMNEESRDQSLKLIRNAQSLLNQSKPTLSSPKTRTDKNDPETESKLILLLLSSRNRLLFNVTIESSSD